MTVVRWQRCACGAIAAAGPFFGYFLWANKESDNKTLTLPKRRKDQSHQNKLTLFPYGTQPSEKVFF